MPRVPNVPRVGAKGAWSAQSGASLGAPCRAFAYTAAHAPLLNLLAIATAVLVSSHVLIGQVPATGWVQRASAIHIARSSTSPPSSPRRPSSRRAKRRNRELTGAAVRKHLEAIVGISQRRPRARREGVGPHHRIPRRRRDARVGAAAVQGRRTARSADADLHRHAADLVSQVVGSEAARDGEGRTRQPRRRARVGVSDERVAASAAVRSARRWSSSAPRPMRRCPTWTSRARSPSRRCTRRRAHSPSARERPSAPASWRSGAPSRS